VKRHSEILERIPFDNTSLAPISGINVGPVTASVYLLEVLIKKLD
jgi:hypothetical protein